MKKPALLCLATPNWEGNYAKTIVEIMSELAADFDILYVDYSFTFKDLFLGGNEEVPKDRIKQKAKSLRLLKTKQGNSIHVLTPPASWPINSLSPGSLYRFFLKWNSLRYRKRIRWAMDQLNMIDPLVVNAFNPAAGRYTKSAFGSGNWIYYCYDNISAAPWLKKHGAYLEQEFIPLVDGVITTSPGLYSAKKSEHARVALVRNGVDFDLFYRAYSLRALRADGPRKPVIGYVGSIDDRIDYRLLDELYRALPDANFHFVGRVMDENLISDWRKRDRVHFFGSQSVDSLPDFLAKFDVALIPFVSNEFTKGIYPLKINEYLAAGLPVVSTEFADLSDFKDTVALSSDPEEFVSAVRSYIEEDHPAARLARTEVAENNSWKARATTFKQILKDWFPTL